MATHQTQVCNFNFFNNDFFFLSWKLTPNPGGIAKSDYGYILQQAGRSNKGERAEMGLHPSIRSLLAANAGFTTGNVPTGADPNTPHPHLSPRLSSGVKQLFPAQNRTKPTPLSGPGFLFGVLSSFQALF